MPWVFPLSFSFKADSTCGGAGAGLLGLCCVVEGGSGRLQPCVIFCCFNFLVVGSGCGALPDAFHAVHCMVLTCYFCWRMFVK